jgi:ATP phosphoribosyltransferase regulatory subunit HisZ
MSDEERQRQMDFILNNLPQVTAKIDGLADIHKADDARTGRLEDAFVTLTKLEERVVDRLDERHTRIDGIEQAIVQLTRLVDGSNGSS